MRASCPCGSVPGDFPRALLNMLNRSFLVPDSPQSSATSLKALVPMVFVAGIGTYDPGTREVVGHDIEEQTAQVLRNFAAVLEGNGSGLAKVVSCSWSLADIERGWKAFDPTYGSFFLSPYVHELPSGPALKGFWSRYRP